MNSIERDKKQKFPKRVTVNDGKCATLSSTLDPLSAGDMGPYNGHQCRVYAVPYPCDFKGLPKVFLSLYQFGRFWL